MALETRELADVRAMARAVADLVPRHRHLIGLAPAARATNGAQHEHDGGALHGRDPIG
jgi:uncharacterized membrane-anchored protein